ncbi:hypothetical protein FLONG3_10998 [Fusarium longipes]|uniref:DUF6546 domain-containing protein n=1 Tax=Fusarium longipes TaxID=694270 RepID=A0A395RJ33_9HYPO|nr:hypothetical protein FLONG3_10998 [Fusarium longipes]
MPGLVATPPDNISGPEEADDTNQHDASTHDPGRPYTQDSKDPLSKTLRGPEPPKKVCETGRLSALGHLVLFQLPSVAITLALVILYSIRIRWGDLNDEQLSYLQFAAKAHEALIIVSLADVLMHRIRSSLLRDESGVPLGFLSSPFTIGSPISYFFSWELWAALLRPGKKTRQAKMGMQLTAMLVIVSIILSIAAAPLSAIAIIPRSGWWQISAPIDVQKYVYTITDTTLWETDLGSEPDMKYFREENSLEEPLGRLQAVVDNPPIGNRRLTNTRQITNTSFIPSPPLYLPSASAQEISITLDFPGERHEKTGWLTVSTVPMSAVIPNYNFDEWENRPANILTRSRLKLLDNYFEEGWEKRVDLTETEKLTVFQRAPTIRWKQPIVAAECSINMTDAKNATFMFNSNITENRVFLSVEDNKDFKAFLKSIQKEKGELPSVRFQFVDLPGNYASPAILFLSYVWPHDDDKKLSADDIQPTMELSLCRIYSRWVEADIWSELGDSVYKSHLETSLFDLQAHFGRFDDLIKMNRAWLTATGRQRDPRLQKELTSPADSLYQQIMKSCDKHEMENIVQRCLSISLAAHVTELLSRLEFPYAYDKLTESNTSSLAPTTGDYVIHEEYFIPGYGYDWKSSRLIPFVFSVLLLHVLIALVHMAIVLSSCHTWHSSSWSSFGQMIVLALRSKALDGLGSVGAGISSSRTWNMPVSIRVVDGEDRLEMILQKEKGVLSQYQELDGDVEEAESDEYSTEMTRDKASWGCLPPEIQNQILGLLLIPGVKFSQLAPVCRVWQTIFEPPNFAEISLTAPRLNHPESRAILYRRRKDIRGPDLAGDLSYFRNENNYIMDMFSSLFTELSLWEPRGDLVLDITVCSPSDNQHWFKNPSILPDTILGECPSCHEHEQEAAMIHDPAHAWINGKRLAMFGNFYEPRPSTSRYAVDFVRTLNPALGQKLARASLNLTTLSVSFMVDAGDFFGALQDSWTWDKLTLLTLTSKFLAEDADSWNLNSMLRDAAAVAPKMPKLDTMELWNAKRNAAMLFRYQRAQNGKPAIIAVRGTYDLPIRVEVTKAWDEVAHRHGHGEVVVQTSWIDPVRIQCHVDAIPELGLLTEVLRPISLQQIIGEHQFFRA